MPDNELANKIKQELLKSGFPLEIRCRQLMRQHDWTLEGDRLFLDEAGVEHEMDAKASKSLIDPLKHLHELESESNRWNPYVGYELIVECKKNTSNHWVFFDDGESEAPLLNTVSTLKVGDAWRLRSMFEEPLSKESPLDHHYLGTKLVSSYCMAFKTDKNQIYDGLREILSAYRHARQQDIELLKPDEEPPADDAQLEDLSPTVYVYYPVLVFDGKLFIAQLVHDSLEVSETTQVVYSAMHPSYVNHRVTVDVIRADIFSRYLSLLERDMEITDSYVMARKFAVSTESKR
jgi:hypothetical protein